MDIKNMYFNGKLDETSYMFQPPDFVDMSQHMCFTLKNHIPKGFSTTSLSFSFKHVAFAIQLVTPL